MNQLSKNLSKVLGSLAGSSKSQMKRSRGRGRRRGGVQPTNLSRPRTVNNTSGRALPAAYAAHVRPRFNVISRTPTSATISGCDLIYPIPAELEPGQDTIFSIFPANPAYWAGTRVAQFAIAYQNYRPLKFNVSYIPQVAVTQSGTVFMGTLWNEAAPTNNIQQSLFTSNGGCLTQCYVPCDSLVHCGRNLQQNLFTMAGELNPNSCPFLFLAGVRGSEMVPGYFYVTYTYEFKNPIGSAWKFAVNANTTVAALRSLARADNTTAVLLNQAGGYGPGTELDVEVVSGQPKIFYHGSPVDLPDTTAIQVYTNSQVQEEASTVLVEAQVGDEIVNFSDYTPTQEEMSIDLLGTQSLIVLTSSYINLYYNSTAGSVSVPAGSRYHIYEVRKNTATLYSASGDTIELSDNAAALGSVILRFGTILSAQY